MEERGNKTNRGSGASPLAEPMLPESASIEHSAFTRQAARRGATAAVVSTLVVLAAVYGADASGILADAILPGALAAFVGGGADLLFALAAFLLVCWSLARMTSAAVPLPGGFTTAERRRHKQHLRGAKSGDPAGNPEPPLPQKRRWAGTIHDATPLLAVLGSLVVTMQFAVAGGGLAWWHLALFATLTPLAAIALGRAAMRTPGRSSAASAKARLSGAIPLFATAGSIFALSATASLLWGPLAFLALLVCPLAATLSRATAEGALRRLPAREIMAAPDYGYTR